jgi:hypothetical protein
MAIEAWYNRNTGLVRVSGPNGTPVTNALDGLTVTGATGEVVSMLDPSGQVVTGETWPVALAESLTPGYYNALISANLSVTNGPGYKLLVTLDAGGGLKADWHVPVTVVDRED